MCACVRSIAFQRMLLAGAVVAVLVAACASARTDGATTSQDAIVGVARDFAAHPAILEIDDADEVFALSDPHGGYGTLLVLLAANGLVDGAGADPTKVTWTGGTATLVIVGDLIDKGPSSLAIIDLVRSLETQAPRHGGRVITTMGNHEAEFLLDPDNVKATSTGKDQAGIDTELADDRIDPKQMAAGQDRAGRGRWLMQLPLGVRIKKWFFAHSGNTQRLSVKELGKKLESSLAHNGFGDPDITGNDSILEAEQWYGDHRDANAGQKEADALGVAHIVFGHDPGAFDDSGKIRQSKNGILIKIDMAMGLHAGSKNDLTPGALLHVSTRGHDSIEILDEHGHSSSVQNAQ